MAGLHRLTAGLALMVVTLTGCGAGGSASDGDAGEAPASEMPASGAPASDGATPASTPSDAGTPTSREVPLRPDGTIDPQAFEDLVTGRTPRTMTRRIEVLPDDGGEAISTLETTTFIDEGAFTFTATEQITGDQRALVSFGEYDHDTKEFTSWRWDGSGWGPPTTQPTVSPAMEDEAGQHIIAVEPDGDDGIAERRFRIEYEPLPEEVGGAGASVTRATITYDENWMPTTERYDTDPADGMSNLITVLSRDEPVEFPAPPPGAHLEPADGVTIAR